MIAMRTTTEIADHYNKIKSDDFLGFQGEVLLPYLSVDEVRPFFKPDTDLSEWQQCPLTETVVLEQMREYMKFAWDKVENHRGISASRSVEKMEAWLWVLGREELMGQVCDAPYENYGAPKLKVICEALGFSVPSSEEVSRMMRGLPCCEGCREGCGQGFG